MTKINGILAVIVLIYLSACSVRNQVDTQDDVKRGVAIVQLALTGAYDTATNLAQAKVISVSDFAAIVNRLDECKTVLDRAKSVADSDPMSAVRWLDAANRILEDVVKQEHMLQGGVR